MNEAIRNVFIGVIIVVLVAGAGFGAGYYFATRGDSDASAVRADLRKAERANRRMAVHLRYAQERIRGIEDQLAAGQQTLKAARKEVAELREAARERKERLERIGAAIEAGEGIAGEIGALNGKALRIVRQLRAETEMGED